jgi:hypothetical protein
MYDRIAPVCFFLLFVAVFFVFGSLCSASRSHEVSVTNPGLNAECNFTSIKANVAGAPFDSITLALVAAAIIILVLIVLIAKLPEYKYKNIKSLTTSEIQEIASLKMTIEKIKSLEDEKRDLSREIDRSKKRQMQRFRVWKTSLIASVKRFYQKISPRGKDS